MSYSPYIVHNGEVIEADSFTLDPKNRAFHYGDGVFETIRIRDGQPLFLDQHWKRAQEGLSKLGIKNSDNVDANEIRNQLEELLQRCQIDKGGRARITLWRSGGGYYTPKSNDMAYIIEVTPLEKNEYQVADEGISVDIFSDMTKPKNPLSPFKLIGSHLFVIASMAARERSLGDVLLLNEKHQIIESARSNVFIVSNGVLYTPGISDGCLGGIMRMQVINLAIENGIRVNEIALTPQHLLAADEMFLTNAIQGIQWVSSYRMKRYMHKTSDRIIDLLNHSAVANQEVSKE